MVIVMEMSTGMAGAEALGSYGEAYEDEVLSAGWAEVPQIEARLEKVVVSTASQPRECRRRRLHGPPLRFSGIEAASFVACSCLPRPAGVGSRVKRLNNPERIAR